MKDLTNAKTQPSKSGYSAQNGVSGRGQTQFLASDVASGTWGSSIDKGGMRGIGLALVLVAELFLKDKAVDLAKDYYKLNKKDYEFFKSTHQAPIQQSVSEAMSDATNPKYTPDFYASVPAGMGQSSISDKQWFEARRRNHRYARGLGRRIDMDFAIVRMHAILGGWNIARRYELTYADEHNNRRFDRKVEVANIGLGIGNIVREGLASSVQNVASAYDNLGDTIATIGNGLAASGGYSAGRKDTASRYGSTSAPTQNSSQASNHNPTIGPYQ